MTEKRFTYLDASKNHYIGSFFCNGAPLTNKEVVDLLNENEQLKADNNRLVNETAKIVAKHQKKVLELIDKKIAEYTEYYETQIEDQSYHEANAMKECVIALQELKRSF